MNRYLLEDSEDEHSLRLVVCNEHDLVGITDENGETEFLGRTLDELEKAWSEEDPNDDPRLKAHVLYLIKKQRKKEAKLN